MMVINDHRLLIWHCPINSPVKIVKKKYFHQLIIWIISMSKMIVWLLIYFRYILTMIIKIFNFKIFFPTVFSSSYVRKRENFSCFSSYLNSKFTEILSILGWISFFYLKKIQVNNNNKKLLIEDYTIQCNCPMIFHLKNFVLLSKLANFVVRQ